MRAARLALIILLLAGAVLACVGGSGGGGDNTNPSGSGPSVDDVTATYGAEQFHLQLTAISRGGQ